MRAIEKLIAYYRNYGLHATLRKIISFFRHSGVKAAAAQIAAPSKIDIYQFYRYVIDKTCVKFSESDYSNYKDGPIFLNWIIPEMGVGSGGHINIFRFVSKLQKMGIRNRIYVHQPINMRTDKELRAFLRANYEIDPDEIEMYCGVGDVLFAHGTVATGWQTAYFVNRFDNTLAKFYFVQDFEPYFYAPGSEYMFAEKTYNFGFYGITAGDWLKEKLHDEYGMETASIGFSYDRELYKPVNKRDNKKRLFFYTRPVTSRRAFELGLLGLIEVYHRIPEIEVVFAGWDISNYEIPFIHLNAGSVKLSELCDLYGQCDMCLVLSATNLSLLPLEIMASNSVVVSNRGANNEWLLNSENCILTDFDPIDIADKIEYYFNHEAELTQIRTYGRQFAQDTSWDEETVKSFHIFTSKIRDAEDKLSKRNA